MHPIAPRIHTKNLAIGYDNKPIVTDLNIEFPSGKISIIVGGSGSGKSTLLRHLLHLNQPIEGTVFIGDKDINSLSKHQLRCIRQRSGVLFQGGALLGSLSVEENVALPLREHTRLTEKQISRTVKDRLGMVGLEEAGHFFPNELSGGMRKRASLARALVMDPQILYCDEPTSGLDPTMSAELDQLLLEMKHHFDMTMIVVTHDLASMRSLADHVVLLGEKQCLFEGTMAELETTTIPSLRRFLDRAPRERNISRVTLPPLDQTMLKLQCSYMDIHASHRKDT